MSWRPVPSPYGPSPYGPSPYGPYQSDASSLSPVGGVVERIVIERFIPAEPPTTPLAPLMVSPPPYYGTQPWQGATPSYGSTMLQPGWYGSSVFPNGHYIPHAVPQQLFVGQAPPPTYPMAGPFLPRPMSNVPIVHRPPSMSMAQRPRASFVPPEPVSHPSPLIGETNTQPLSPDVVQNQEVDVRVHQTAAQVLPLPIGSSLPAESDLQRAHNIPKTSNSSTLPVLVEKETSLGTLPPHTPTTDNAEQAMQLPSKRDDHSLHSPKSRRSHRDAKSKRPPVQRNPTSSTHRDHSTSQKEQHASSSGNKSGAGDSKRFPPKPQVNKDDRVGGPSSVLQVASRPPITLQESETTPPFKEIPTSTLPLPPLSVPTMSHTDMALKSTQRIGGSESKKKSTSNRKEPSKQAEPSVQSKKPKSKKEPSPSLHVYRSPFPEIRKQLECAIPIPADSEIAFQYLELTDALEEVKKTKGSSVSSKSGDQTNQNRLRELSLQCELFAQQFARLPLQKAGQTSLHQSPDDNLSQWLKELEEALNILFSGLGVWNSEDRWDLLSPWIIQSVPNGSLTTELPRVDSMSDALPKETAQLVQLCTMSRLHLEDSFLREALPSSTGLTIRKQAASCDLSVLMTCYQNASKIMLTLRDRVQLERVEDVHPIARLLGAMQLAQPPLQSLQAQDCTLWPNCLAQTLLFIELWPEFLKGEASSRFPSRVVCYQKICEWGMVQAHKYLTKDLMQRPVSCDRVQKNSLGYLSLYSAITRLHLPLIQPLFQNQKKLKNELLKSAAKQIVELIPMLKEIGKPILGQDSLSIVQEPFLKEELEPYYLALARFVSTYPFDDGLLAQASEAERVLFQLGLSLNVTTDAHPLQWQHVCPPNVTWSLDFTKAHDWKTIQSPISYAMSPSYGFWDPQPTPLHFGGVFDGWLRARRNNADYDQQLGTFQRLPHLEHSVQWCTKWAAATYEDLQRTILSQSHPALADWSSCFTQCIPIQEWREYSRVYQLKYTTIQDLWSECMAVMKAPINETQLALNSTHPTTLQQLQDEVQEVTKNRLLPALTPFVAFLQDVKVDPPSLWLWNQLGLQLIDIIALHLYTQGCVRIANGMNHSKEPSRNPLQGILLKLHDREIQLISILQQWLVCEAGLAGCVHAANESLPITSSYAMMWILQQRPYTVHEERRAYVFPWLATGNEQQNGRDIALYMQPISMQDVDSWYSESKISDPIYQQMQKGMEECLGGVRRQSLPFNQEIPNLSLAEIPDDLFQALRQIPWMHWVLPERKEAVDRVALFTFLTHLWLRRLSGVHMVMECQLSSQTSSLQQTRDAIRTMAQTVYHLLHGPELPAPSVWDEAVNQQVTEPLNSFFRVPLDQVALLV